MEECAEKDWADKDAAKLLKETPVLVNGLANQIAAALRDAAARGYGVGWSSGERSGYNFPRTN